MPVSLSLPGPPKPGPNPSLAIIINHDCKLNPNPDIRHISKLTLTDHGQNATGQNGTEIKSELSPVYYYNSER